MEEYIRSDRHLERSEIEAIRKKHGRVEKGWIHYLIDYFGENSPARLLFFQYSIPSPLWNILKKFVKPFEIKLTPVNTLPVRDVDVLKSKTR